MNQRTLLPICILLTAVSLIFPQTQPNPQPQGPASKPAQKIGKVLFPSDFVHAGKEYTKGTYTVFLVEKENWPFFQVYNQKNELLFEEMAIVTSLSKRQAKEASRGLDERKEYFHIRLIRKGSAIMGYFLVKPAGVKPSEEKKTEKN